MYGVAAPQDEGQSTIIPVRQDIMARMQQDNIISQDMDSSPFFIEGFIDTIKGAVMSKELWIGAGIGILGTILVMSLVAPKPRMASRVGR